MSTICCSLATSRALKNDHYPQPSIRLEKNWKQLKCLALGKRLNGAAFPCAVCTCLAMEPFFKWNIRWKSRMQMDWFDVEKGVLFPVPHLDGRTQSVPALYRDSSWGTSMANVGLRGVAQSHCLSHGIWIAFPSDWWNSGWFFLRYFYFSILAKFFIVVFFWFFFATKYLY